MNAEEYNALCEEHGMQNIILYEDFSDYTLSISVKHDGSVILIDKINSGASWIRNAVDNMDRYLSKHSELITSLLSGNVPKKINENEIRHRALRNKVTAEHHMWALIDMEWTFNLSKILKGKRCLEICAGVGWLSNALDQHGVDCLATDRTPNLPFKKSSKYKYLNNDIFPVEKLDHSDAINKYIDNVDVIICSWPPYSTDGDGVLTKSVKLLKKLNRMDIGIIYIGEYDGGCTDSNSLWEVIDYNEIIKIPSWEYINDDCYVCNIV